MRFKHKKSDVMIILSKIEISAADCLKSEFVYLCKTYFCYLVEDVRKRSRDNASVSVPLRPASDSECFATSCLKVKYSINKR